MGHAGRQLNRYVIDGTGWLNYDSPVKVVTQKFVVALDSGSCSIKFWYSPDLIRWINSGTFLSDNTYYLNVRGAGFYIRFECTVFSSLTHFQFIQGGVSRW